MKLKTRVQSQRSSQWGSIMLGYNTSLPYNIYNYGCLITSLANYVDKQPDEVNVILKDNNGFSGGGNFVWSKSSSLGIKETYISPRCQAIPLYSTEVIKLREFIKNGHPALCEVDFNPATDGEEMHYVLAVGFTDTEIIVVDPWEGQYENWTDAAFQRNTYQYRIYDKVLPQDDNGETLPVKKTDFENMRRKCDIYDKVLQKLNIADNETIVLADIDHILTYEQAIQDKEKQIKDAKKQIDDLKAQLIEVSVSHNALEDQYDNLKKDIQSDTTTIQELMDKISNLEKQMKQPIKSGWQLVLEGIHKIVNGK